VKAHSILMVTGAYWPELSGGGLQCRTMIHALKVRHRFSVLTTCADRSLPASADVEGVPVARLHVDLARPWTKVTAALKTVAFFFRRHGSFDAVHLHGFSQKSVLIVVLSRLFGKKLLLTIHTADHDEAGCVRQRGRLAYWAYRQADRYVAISSRIAGNYRAAGLPKARLLLAPNGVDVSRFHPPTDAQREAARKALGLSPDLRWLLFVGFFSREKAPHLLFEAWLRVQATEAPPSGLLFVGATESNYREVDKNLAEEIAAQAERRGLSDRVRFTGPLLEVEQAYHAADIFVMPSTREAFGMVLVEAMASAVPVIATKIAGVTDEIVADGRTGLLVPPGDAEALSEAIRRLLIDGGHARELGAAAREAVTARFSLEAVTMQWQTIYEGLQERAED
jgi:glycosyltransferase involved in cell wall biosynthesis